MRSSAAKPSMANAANGASTATRPSSTCTAPAMDRAEAASSRSNAASAAWREYTALIATSATVAAASAIAAATSRRRPSEKPLGVVGASRIAGAPHGHDRQGRAVQLAAQARDVKLQRVLRHL